jgi:hypothetical protein
MSSTLHNGSYCGKVRFDSRPYPFCKDLKDNDCHGAADLDDRPRFCLSSSFSIYSIDLTDDRKLGYGFTSADELEEIDIGPGDKPRPTFVSKKLRPCSREPMIALLKEYANCFAWDYTETPGLDRCIVEHRLPLKSGFRPFQQRARQMKAEVLVEVKKRGGEDVRSRIHQALQVCRVDFKCCTYTEEGWPMASLRGLQRPQQDYFEG